MAMGDNATIALGAPISTPLSAAAGTSSHPKAWPSGGLAWCRSEIAGGIVRDRRLRAALFEARGHVGGVNTLPLILKATILCDMNAFTFERQLVDITIQQVK